MEVLIADNITKAYSNPVLMGTSLSVAQSECIGIVGQNGCGKSTFLAILAGGLKPDGGSLTICGEDALKNRRVFSKYVGYMPQNDPIVEELSVKDNLMLWYSLAKVPLKPELKSGGAIDRMGLMSVLNKRAGALSGGMRRRLNMAGALVSGSKLLILDEPSTGLDVVRRQEMTEHYTEYLNTGGAIIMATHSREEMDLCTRLLILENGVLHSIDWNITMNRLASIIRNNK